MTDHNCQHIQDKIGDYLNGQLDETQRQAVESHLMDCADCEKVLKVQKRLLNMQQKEPPAMPDAFWQAFPEQVLAEYKTQKAHAARQAKSPGRFSFVGSWLQNRLALTGLALASGLLLVVGISLLLNDSQTSQHTPTRDWAAGISQPQRLAKLLERHSIIQQQPHQLAFASQVGQANFFTNAAVYVEALSLLAGGDNLAARRQLEYLQVSTAKILTQGQGQQLRSLIQAITDKGQTTPDLLNQMVALERTLHNSALQLGQQQVVLWDTGLLISRLKLSALLKDTHSIQQFDALDSLQQRLRQSTLPPGVADAIDKIQAVIKAGVYTEKELNILTEQTTRIQLIIG